MTRLSERKVIHNERRLFVCLYKTDDWFLLSNSLLKKQLVIFTDGARTIHGAVEKMLCFANYKIILDWYHLHKKCKEQLSMALKSSKTRNEFLNLLMPCLWFGNVDGAIELLKEIESNKVKNYEYIQTLIGYFQRVRGYIPALQYN